MTNILLQQQGSAMPMLLMMVVIFAIVYFTMIRPQQKEQKKIREFQNQLTEGTPVVTGGGIYGTVKSVDQARQTVDVKIARDVVVTVNKTSVFRDMASAQPQAK